MYFKISIICLFVLSVITADAQPSFSSVEVQFDKEKYDFYYSINIVRDFLEDTILLYNETENNVLKVTEFIRSKDMTYVNLGNNQIEGTFYGIIDKKRNKKLRVTYKKISTINLTTSDVTYTYSISDGKKIIVPIQFNKNSNQLSFDSMYLSLFEKGKNTFINYFEVDYNDGRFSIEESLNKTKAGSYAGNMVFRQGEQELKQPIEVNIKHSFLTALIAFIISFALSYLVRYFSINEEKVSAYVRAKNLLENGF